MVLPLLYCVLEDGFPSGPGVPLAVARTVEWQQGVDMVQPIEVRTRGGVPVDLTGKTLTLTVRKRVGDTIAALIKTGSLTPQEGLGRALFTISASDIALFSVGYYVYDISLLTGTVRDLILPVSPLVVVPGFLSDSPLSPSPSQALYSCPSSVQVGDAVYLTGPDAIDRASAVSEGTTDAFGFVGAKPTATLAQVVTDGDLSAFVGLDATPPGNVYFLGLVPGTITNDVSGYGSGNVTQQLGTAKNTTTLVIEVEPGVTLT